MRWSGRTQGGSFGQKFILYMVKYTDIRFCYCLLLFIVPFFIVFSHKNCMAIYRYFRERHGYSCLKSWRNCYVNHFLFGQLIFDRFAVFAGKNNIFKVEIVGEELFNKVMSSPRPVLIAGAHIGNFEIAGYLLHQVDKPINAIVFEGEAKVIQQLRDKELCKNNVCMIPVRADLSHIFEINAALERGEAVSMPCDRFFTGKKCGRVNFLGAIANFPTGAFHIATRCETEVITIFVVKSGLLRYKIFVDAINTDNNKSVDILLNRYVQVMERIINRYPAQWYNFYNFWNNESN